MDASGDLHVGTVVVDVLDMDRAVAFWTAALGYETRENAPDPEFPMREDPGRQLPRTPQGAEVGAIQDDLADPTRCPSPRPHQVRRVGRGRPSG